MTFPKLPDAPRLLLEATLRPVQGTRFQPTGFPDLGAATYRLADTTEMLLVESAQSVANRLESTCWDEAEHRLVAPLRGLPYVEVVRDGKVITNSLLEAHRLNSAYIEHSDVSAAIRRDIDYKKDEPVDRPRFIRTLCKYDPGSLLHGVFLESIAGVLRLPRALGGFIEARDVRVVSSGGVKNDRVMAEKDEAAGTTAKEGFGNVPFHRDEYTAATLTAYFNLDLDQLRSYRLGPELEQCLYALALFKVQRFLARGLRLRTACDLEADELRVTRPAGLSLPPLSVIAETLPGLITTATRAGLFADPPVTRAIFQPPRKGKAKPAETDDASDDASSDEPAPTPKKPATKSKAGK